MQAGKDTGRRRRGGAADVSTFYPPWHTWTCVLTFERAGMFTARCPELGIEFSSPSYAAVCVALMDELARHAAAALSTKGAAGAPPTGARPDNRSPDEVITYRQ